MSFEESERHIHLRQIVKIMQVHASHDFGNLAFARSTPSNQSEAINPEQSQSQGRRAALADGP
jgi:hypothetical protein